MDTPGTLVSSTNKTDVHDLTEILLKMALKTKKANPYINVEYMYYASFIF